jgi:hypothetical protein
MWKDPIVEEVRKVRHQLEKEYGSNMNSIFRHIYKRQIKNNARLVKLSPKFRILKKAA